MSFSHLLDGVSRGRLRIVALSLLLVSTPGLTSDALPPHVTLLELGVGDLYLKDEVPLYTYRRDVPGSGRSVCNDVCAEIWPPFFASDDDVAESDWSIIKRDDGSAQWAYLGRPVHTNVGDSGSGSLVGEKDNYWEPVIDPTVVPGAISIDGTFSGQTLVGLNGRTLYWNVNGDECDRDCARGYVPVEAAWMASSPSEKWSITETDGGLRQWVYEGKALFRSRDDYQSGEANGINEDLGWAVAVVQLPRSLPDWVTIEETDLGSVLANQDGMTLYSLPRHEEERVARETCDSTCVATHWRTIAASNDAESIGNWSVVATASGDRYWHYLGLPVYTYVHDRMRGDIYGEKFGAGGQIQGGWRAIPREQLIQNLYPN